MIVETPLRRGFLRSYTGDTDEGLSRHDGAARTAHSSEGFRDGSGHYLTTVQWSGVWVSDRPLDSERPNPTAADIVLEIEVDGRTIARYEWIERGKPYREWLVPASQLNRGATRVVTDK